MVSEVSTWYFPKRLLLAVVVWAPVLHSSQFVACLGPWTAPVTHSFYVGPTSPSSVVNERILLGRKLGIPSIMAHFFFLQVTPLSQSGASGWGLRTASFTVKDTAAPRVLSGGDEGVFQGSSHLASSDTDPVLHWPLLKWQGSSLSRRQSPRLAFPFVSGLSSRREPSL